MLRIFLKLNQVWLRLNQTVQLSIFIRKQNEKFQIPKKGVLLNGIAQINTNIQFFIHQQNPIFDILIILSCKDVKKYGGVCKVDLSKWPSDSRNIIVDKLMSCPDNKASIQYQFIFMTSGLSFNKNALVSKTQMQIQKSNSMLENKEKQLEQYLSNEHTKLIEQKQKLTNQNQELRKGKKDLSQQHLSKEQKYILKLSQKQLRFNQCQDQIRQIQKKIRGIYKAMENYKQKDGSVQNNQQRKLLMQNIQQIVYSLNIKGIGHYQAKNMMKQSLSLNSHNFLVNQGKASRQSKIQMIVQESNWINNQNQESPIDQQ